jgi:hypothetical protein
MLPKKIVCLFDVANTLLDNDHVVADLMGYLEREIGHVISLASATGFEPVLPT